MTFASEVRMVVSRLPGLKKRAAMPPKPQLVSSEWTTKGKASRFLVVGAAKVSLWGSGSWIFGNLIVKGTMSFLLGMLSTTTVLCRCQAKADMDNNNKKKSGPALITRAKII